MRVAISFALTYPDRAATRIAPLDFTSGLILEFFPPDEEAFPCLALARAAGEAGRTMPCVLNAANEIAVARRQVAKLFERRAAASLGRLRAAQQAQSAR